MAVGDHRPVASDRPHQNHTLGWQSPSRGYENNSHPTQPRNNPLSNRDQVNKPYPSPYQSQPQVRPVLSSEPPIKTTGYGYGHNPPPIQPQVYQQPDVPPPKNGNGYPEPRSNQDQVNKPHPSPYPSQPQGVPPPSSEPPPRTAGYRKHNPPSIQPYVNQQADASPLKHGNGYPEPRSNHEPYLSPYQDQPQGVPPPSSKPPPRTTTGYGYGHNPPPIQPQLYQQADVSPPKHGNGYPKPRPDQIQVSDCYSSPQECEEGGYGSSNGVGHRMPSTEAKMYGVHQQNPPPVVAKPNQPHGSPAVHGDGEENRPDCYTYPTQPQEKEAPSHGWGNYQSDQFNVHEHDPPSLTVKPHIPATFSVNGYPPTKVTARVDPQTHTQGHPYQDPSTKSLGFADPNKRKFNAIKPKEVPLPAGGHGTSHGYSYEQSNPYKGDERSPVSPSGGHKVHVIVDVKYDPHGGQASVNGSSKPNKGSNQSGSRCFDSCSIM